MTPGHGLDVLRAQSFRSVGDPRLQTARRLLAAMQRPQRSTWMLATAHALMRFTKAGSDYMCHMSNVWQPASASLP